MKKTIVLAIIVFLMFTNFSYIPGSNVSGGSINDNELVLTCTFDSPQIEKITIDGNIYSKITMSNDDLISYNSEPGEPKIPVKGCKIAIPYGQQVESVHVKKSNPISFSVDFKVEPAQGVIPIDYDGEINFDEPKEKIYNSDDFYPSYDYRIVNEQCFRGYDFLILQLYPVKYRSLTNKLYFYESMEITVKTSDVSDLKDSDLNYRGLKKDQDLIKKIVDNPQSIDDRTFTLDSVSTDDIYEYVIITTDDLKNSQSGYTFNDLVNAKTNVGLNTKIMTVQEIRNSHSGSNTEEKIRNFIKYAYNNWQTDYVLLAGDVDKVPTVSVTVQKPDGAKTVPCDLYYACLDSPAPDGTYNCDLTAEVYVGRAPVGNSQEVSNFVKKTLGYMDTEDDYIHNALWIAENLGRGMLHGKEMIKQSIGHCEDDGYKTDGLPEGMGEYEYDVKWLYGSGSAESELNSDKYHLVNYIGHSNTGMCMSMSSSRASSIRNDNYFFVYGQSCNSGNFQASDCFAEHITVKNSNGGAFATIMNSKYGYQYLGSTDGPNNRFCRQFWDSLYGEKTPIFGQAFFDSKYDNLHKIGDSYMLFTYYTVVFLGDPSLVVKNTEPHLLYSPHEHDFGNMEKGETNSISFKIWNLGTEEMVYSLSEDYDWVSVSPKDGTSSSGERDIITVNIDTTDLSDGTHNGYINIESNFGSGIFKISVKVGANLAFHPKSCEVCVPKGEQSMSNFKIWNDGLGTLSYTLESNVDWLTVSPAKGESSGEYDSIIITMDAEGLEDGWHKGYVYIYSEAGNDTFQVMLGVEGPDRPVNIEPEHNKTGLDTDVKLSVMVKDPDGGSMDVCFHDAFDDSLIDFVENVESGDTASIYWNDLEHGRTYSWYATANDSVMMSYSYIFSFTTNCPPVFSNVCPMDGAMDTSFDLDKLSLYVSDPEGDSFDWSITTKPNIGSKDVSGDYDGEKTCDVYDLKPDFEYNWNITAIDSKGGTSTFVYFFKTEENIAPEIPNIVFPKDNDKDISVTDLVLNWSCNDPNEGDIVSYNVYFGKSSNPELLTENVSDEYYVIDYYLDIETKYYWKVKAIDSYGEITESNIISFTTGSIPPPPKPGDIDIIFSKKLCHAGVKVEIVNKQDRGVSNVNWHISVTGGLFDSVDVSTGGNINRLNLNERKYISTNSLLDFKSKVIGFGKVKITVITKNVNGETVCMGSSEGLLLGFSLFIINS